MNEMMKNFKFLLFTIFLAVSGGLQAQEENSFVRQNIFEVLQASDGEGKVIIHQDKRIENLINQKQTAKTGREATLGNGYRVQVFSSNEQRTGKVEAFKIEKEIREAFPNTGVYVNYNSPFWKVRVGDFSTVDEAQAFRNKLLEVFPDLRSQTYVVRDQIVK
jgi:hypothetical protein